MRRSGILIVFFIASMAVALFTTEDSVDVWRFWANAQAGEKPVAMVTASPTPLKIFTFDCKNELYVFLLDHIRGLRGTDKAGDLEGADEAIRRAGIANCDELFRVDRWADLDGDGQPEVIVRTSGTLWATARSDARTWVVQKNKAGYRVILDAGFVSDVNVERRRARGFYVLKVDRHNGGDGFMSGTYVCREDGYRLRECFLARFNAYPVRKELSECEPVF